MLPIAFLSYSKPDEAATHRLYMDFMLNNATPRMMQLVIDDVTQRQKMLHQSIRSTDVVLAIVSSNAEDTALQQEQVEIALLSDKPIRVINLDSGMLPTWLTSRVKEVVSYSFAEQAWDDATLHLLTSLDIPLQQLSDQLPDTESWVPDKWRVKFYNGATNAHGYGELELKDDHSVQGTLNIAQGKLTAQTTVTATWKLVGRELTIEGQQIVRPMRQPLSYLLSVTISQYGPYTFRAQTAQGDDSVFQRAPK